jgi:hypothetical protein
MMAENPEIRTAIEARRAARAAGIAAEEPLHQGNQDVPVEDILGLMQQNLQADQFLQDAQDNHEAALAALQDPEALRAVLNVLESIRPYATGLNIARLSTIFTVYQMIDAIHDVLNNPHDMTRLRVNATLVMAGIVLADETLVTLLNETTIFGSYRETFVTLYRRINLIALALRIYLRPSTVVFHTVINIAAGLLQARVHENIARNLYNVIIQLPCHIL